MARSLVPSSCGLLVMLGIFLLLVTDRPQELGVVPLGEDKMPPVPAAVTANFVLLSFQALQAGSTRFVFWVLAATFFICGISSYGLTQTHFVPFCGDLGIPLVTSASLLSVIGVCDLIGTIGSGWLSDRYDNRVLLAVYYALRGASLVWLVYGQVSLVALIGFAVVYGLDFIATVPPTVRLTVATFGRERGPAVFGWIFAAHQLGVGIMAFGAGVWAAMRSVPICRPFCSPESFALSPRRRSYLSAGRRKRTRRGSGDASGQIFSKTPSQAHSPRTRGGGRFIRYAVTRFTPNKLTPEPNWELLRQRL